MGAKSLSAGLGIREFARREGCDDKLVRRAIQQGRLATLADGTLSAGLIGTGWRKTNRRAQDAAAAASADIPADKSAPAAADTDLSALLGGTTSLLEAERAKASALAAKHVIAARRAAGELVEAELAERVLFDEARRYRDAWRNWPSKVAPLIAADLGLTPEAVLEVIGRHVHEQLAELGEPEGEFGGPPS